MCMHHLTLERRSGSDADYDYETIADIDLGGGRGLPNPTAEQIEQMRATAAAYLALHPEHADEITLVQSSCNGTERDFDLPAGADPDVEQLTALARRLWDALQTYSQPGFYRTRQTAGGEGQIVLSCPALTDAGAAARTVLSSCLTGPPTTTTTTKEHLR